MCARIRSLRKYQKNPPPKPWPLLKYTPVKIIKPFTDGQGQLPNTIASDDPYAIFGLFFDEETLKILVQHTNEYAFLYPASETPDSRKWWPTTVKEFRAYLRTSIWMGLHVESSVPDFWNKDSLKGAVYEQVFKHISLKRWQQIDRFFHVSKPLPPNQKESTFDKLEPLSDTLRQVFKKYWKAGTHLAVDETI